MEKYYAVSFGDSNTYSVAAPMDVETLRKKLVGNLSERFPFGHAKNVVTVDLREVSKDEAAQYRPLDEETISSVAKVLKREMQTGADTRDLNNPSPYAATSKDS